MVWGAVSPSINTANGIIQNGSGAGISESLVSEARFFRSFYYFLLVQTYGGVPLDLGSGELQFNINPKTSSVRNIVPEVYTKAVFQIYLKRLIIFLPIQELLVVLQRTSQDYNNQKHI